MAYISDHPHHVGRDLVLAMELAPAANATVGLAKNNQIGYLRKVLEILEKANLNFPRCHLASPYKRYDHWTCSVYTYGILYLMRELMRQMDTTNAQKKIINTIRVGIVTCVIVSPVVVDRPLTIRRICAAKVVGDDIQLQRRRLRKRIRGSRC